MTATGTWRAVVRLACGERKRKTAPDGQISVRAQKLSSPFARNILLNPSGKSALPARPVLSRQEGRIAIVTNAGEDAVDATASARRLFAGRSSVSEQQRAGRTTLFAYGKTVWS